MRRWHLRRRVLFVLLVAFGLAIASTFLPDNAYQRFQLLDQTTYPIVRRNYERLHFDPRPIDVAIIGDSTTLLSLRASQIEQRLAQDGKPATVANLSLVGAGRNSEWLYVRDLLKTKKPKVLVLALGSQPWPWGHDSFRYIAPARDIWDEAFHGLHDATKNLVYLPFRQMKLFMAYLFPGLSGMRTQFDPALYAATRSDYTSGHWMGDSGPVEMDQQVPRDKLIEQAARHKDHDPAARSGLRGRISKVVDADDSVYMQRILAAARSHGVKVLFVYIPRFRGPTTIKNAAFYEAQGQVLNNADLRDQDALYQGWAHVNAAGASVVSDRVAAEVEKMLP